MHDSFAAVIASKMTCGGKPFFSPLPLILTLILTLNPNPKDLTNQDCPYLP